MHSRYAYLWFPHPEANWWVRRQPQLQELPFVLQTPVGGHLRIAALNALAAAHDIRPGMSVADAKALVPQLEVLDHQPELAHRLMKRLAGWCIRFTPVVQADGGEGILLEVTGCTHLWEGEEAYGATLLRRLRGHGYEVSIALADTIGAAWGVARFGKTLSVVPPQQQQETMASLPAAALRLETELVEKLGRLGLRRVGDFMHMARPSLRRRFGAVLLLRLDQAFGWAPEAIIPLHPPEPYRERLHCLEPIITRTGIEAALEKLLNPLCGRLAAEKKGLRTALLQAFRVDGGSQQVRIQTSRPTHQQAHLLRLFGLQVGSIAPGLGIELFVLEAGGVEECTTVQHPLWASNGETETDALAELLDRIGNKLSQVRIGRCLPAEHWWAEGGVQWREAMAVPEVEKVVLPRRPLRFQHPPEQVVVECGDEGLIAFHYEGAQRWVVHCEGPERLEPEWWLNDAACRDYYCVEDREGGRYWLFCEEGERWFLHGFFA